MIKRQATGHRARALGLVALGLLAAIAVWVATSPAHDSRFAVAGGELRVSETSATHERSRVVPSIGAESGDQLVDATPERPSRTVVISGAVLGPAGELAGEATVEIRGGEDNQCSTVTVDSTGLWSMTVDFPENCRRVHAQATCDADRSVSPTRELVIPRDGRVPFILLKLHDGLTIAGRVVDSLAEPQGGVEIAALMDHPPTWGRQVGGMPGRTENVTVASEDDGKFSIRVRANGRLRLTLRRPGQPWGPATWYEANSGPILHVGDLIVADIAETCTWRLHVQNTAGSPIAGALVRFGVGEALEMEEHARFQADVHALKANDEGELSIELAIRSEPVIVGVGHQDVAVRGFGLDCTHAGTFDAVLTVPKNPSVIIALVGPGGEALGGTPSLAKVVSSVIDSSGTSGRGAPVVDVTTGGKLEVGRERQALAERPFELLQGAIAGLGTAELVGPGRFRVRATDGPGRYLVSVSVGELGRLASESVEIREGDVDRLVAVQVPGGRVLAVDWQAFLDWRQTSGVRFLPTYAVWAAQPAVATGADGTVVDSPTLGSVSTVAPVLLATGTGSTVTPLWLPTGTDSVVLGFVESGSDGGHVAVHASEVISVVGVDTLRVSAPEAALPFAARIAVAVRMPDGRPAPEGLPITIRRFPPIVRTGSPAPEGFVEVLTGAGGGAEIRVFRGSYAAELSRGVSERPRRVAEWPRAEVRDAPCEAKIELTLRLPK